MDYSITFENKDYDSLTEYLFKVPGIEQAAYALGRISRTENETRLLIREILPLIPEEIIEAASNHMIISSLSVSRALKKADQTKQCFIFIHSHPDSVPMHSQQDDLEEKKLFSTAYTRIHSEEVHGSIIFSSPEMSIARIWLEDGTYTPVKVIRTVGDRFRFFYNQKPEDSLDEIYDRQVRAFGKDIQRILNNLTIGIVGVGGTGSSIAEQLIRLGVGKLIIADSQNFEKSNINRLYGSKITDENRKKVDIINDLSENIGLETKLVTINKDITFKSSTEKFKECDIIFGCTDDEWGRSLLNRLSVYYLIPVFDMGVKIDSGNGIIKAIAGRVTILLAGEACLFCRERLNPENINNEYMQALYPEEAKKRRKEGYIPELAETAPAVIPFTTTIASTAIMMLLHKLTGYMGKDFNSSEIIVKYHELSIRSNKRPFNQNCFCADPYYRGRGDVKPLLDTTWRPE